MGGGHLPDAAAAHLAVLVACHIHVAAQQMVGHVVLHRQLEQQSAQPFTEHTQRTLQHLLQCTRQICARRKPCKHGADGFFTKNSAKVHSGPDNQRQSQNAANPRGSPHCGLPRKALAQKSANAFLLPLPSSSAEPGKSTKIRPKEALNPSPGQGRCPTLKEAAQRLTGANTGLLRPVPPASAALADAPARPFAAGNAAPRHRT